MTPRPRVVRLAALVATAVLTVSCAETVVDIEADDGTAGGSEVDADGTSATVPTTTEAIVGSTGELLAEMSTQMSQLSSQIGGDGDEQATLRRIEAIWDVARPDVEAARAELVSGIDTTVAMARTAVVRIRPADGDKAFQLLTDLVDRFTGDG